MRRLALFVVHRRWVVIVVALLFLPIAAIVGGGVAEAADRRRARGSRRGVGAHLGRDRAAVRQRRSVGLRRARHRPPRRRRRPGGPGRRARDHEAAGGRARHRRRVVVLGREPRPRSRATTASRRWSFGSVQGDLDDKVEGRRRSCRRSTRPTTDVVPPRSPGGPRSPARSASRPSRTSSGPSCSPRRSSFIALVIVFGGIVAALLPLSVGVLAVVGTLLDPDAPRVAHRRLGVRAEPHDRARASASRSTTACSSSPATARSSRTACRPTSRSDARCRPPAARCVFSAGDGDDLAVRAAALPRPVPAVVRLRRGRGRRPRRDRRGRSSCPRSSRCSGRGWRRGASSSRSPPSEDGFWGRQARRVMKHPIPYAVGVSARAASCSRSRSSTSTSA